MPRARTLSCYRSRAVKVICAICSVYAPFNPLFLVGLNRIVNVYRTKVDACRNYDTFQHAGFGQGENGFISQQFSEKFCYSTSAGELKTLSLIRAYLQTCNYALCNLFCIRKGMFHLRTCQLREPVVQHAGPRKPLELHRLHVEGGLLSR